MKKLFNNQSVKNVNETYENHINHEIIIEPCSDIENNKYLFEMLPFANDIYQEKAEYEMKIFSSEVNV